MWHKTLNLTGLALSPFGIGDPLTLTIKWDWLWALLVQLRWKAKKGPFQGVQTISEIPL